MKYNFIVILFFFYGICSGQNNSKSGCYEIDEYLISKESLPAEATLNFPCLNELIDSNTTYLDKKFLKIKELSATKSEVTMSEWLAERLEFRVSYTNEISRLEEQGDSDRFFIVEDDDGYDVEAGLVFSYPFDSYYKYKKTKRLKGLELDRLDLEKEELTRESNVLISDIYQDFESLIFAHNHCVCTLDFANNCTPIFYKLREKALKLLYLSSYTNEYIIDLWEKVNPDNCGAPTYQ